MKPLWYRFSATTADEKKAVEKLVDVKGPLMDDLLKSLRRSGQVVNGSYFGTACRHG